MRRLSCALVAAFKAAVTVSRIKRSDQFREGSFQTNRGRKPEQGILLT
jgi:hypothetical protein